MSQDDVTRFLYGLEAGSRALWQEVKPVVRQAEKALPAEEPWCLLLDDCIVGKAHPDGNGLVTVHHDHSKGRYARGLNLVSALPVLGGVLLPVAYKLELGQGLEQVYIRQLETPLLLCKDFLINGDGSQATQYLLSTGLTRSFQQVITTYQRRWGVEEHQKPLNQNTSVAKAPVKTTATQAKHLFCSTCAFVKPERLKVVDHFALKAKRYIKATQAAFKQLAQHELNLA